MKYCILIAYYFNRYFINNKVKNKIKINFILVWYNNILIIYNDNNKFYYMYQ